MIENLKVALKRQKKLLIIFFLTIFLPSVTLSIFGVRAIRNERFRQAKQLENEHRRAADSIKIQLSAQFGELESTLKNMAEHPALLSRDIPLLTDLTKNQLGDIPLAEHVFVAYNRGDTLFPLFAPAQQSSRSLKTAPLKTAPLNASQRELLKRAEENEFKLSRYNSAISLYSQLFSRSDNEILKAQMLSNIGRCYTKTKDFKTAISFYERICNDYPEATSSSGLPLCLIARLQMLHCYQNLGSDSVLLNQALRLYGDILNKPWELEEDQFKIYSSIVSETILESLSQAFESSTYDSLSSEYEEIKIQHQKKIEEWAVINMIKGEIIPEINRSLNQQDPSRRQPLRYSKTIEDDTNLFIAASIPDGTGSNPKGLLGVKLNNDYITSQVLNRVIEDLDVSDNADIVLSNLSGESLLGETPAALEFATVTDYFENNFPPWKIEIFRKGTDSLGGFDIRKSFYFWTIVTLVLILTFGAALIIRTIANEMEILKIKSDFVSSVSHELKTPLTSIKALVERLQEGKVKEKSKMQQYFSVISQDADKLTNLVTNILDFSKIEEGKKEYNFVETDVSQWMTQCIENLKKNDIQKGLAIHSDIAPDLPSILLDRDSLSQALNNLIDNAEKFSQDRKEINLNVKLDGTNIIISITDYGIGIPQTEIDKIFDKFYQGKSALSQSVRGTGLGLTLVKHIVEAHGGRVSVKSEMGQGSTFALILPMEKKEG
jgi:signal transduction histidine kinase